MATVTIDTLKTYFNTKDKPTESQYVDLIDTLSNFDIEVALAQLDTDITATTGVAKFPIPANLTFLDAFIRVDTAPTGSNAIWDININGSTVLSTKITIEVTELTSKDAASQPVFSTTTADEDDACTIDCDQIGSTIAGQNPVLVIKCRKR